MTTMVGKRFKCDWKINWKTLILKRSARVRSGAHEKSNWKWREKAWGIFGGMVLKEVGRTKCGCGN